MKGSLERKCENLVAQLLKLDPALAAKPFRLSDDTRPAKLGHIVVEAVMGQQELDGAKCSSVEVTAEYRSGTDEPADIADAVAEAMHRAIYSAKPGSVDALKGFAFISIEPEARGERPNSKTYRSRQLKVPILAKEA